MELPQLFIERVKQVLPEHVDIQKMFGPRAYKAFRVNVLKASIQEVLDFLNGQDIVYEPVPWYAPAFVVDPKDAPLVLGSDLAAQGKIYAQGLESMLAVVALGPQPGEAVLDLCAAPGSKTSQIAAHMNNEGALTANEPVRSRFFRLKSVVELLGAKVNLKSFDGRFFRSQELYDRILVDAPCSSEGRFVSDEPKSYAYWSLRKVHEMAHKQKGLLLNASRLLKPGGVLLYATCTFSVEENEAVVEWFLRKTQGKFRLVPQDLGEVATYPSSVEHCVRILPNDRMDGFFLAKFSCDYNLTTG